jgi:benzoate/toluate 1,2-dioxygenase subunit beta
MKVTTTSVLLDVQAFVFREARFLDERRYDDWLELWAMDRDVRYWIPADDDENETETLSFAYDNARRIQTRVKQLQTGERYAQIPVSTTVRIVSNVEAEELDDGVILARATFILHEHRSQRTHVWAGRLTYHLLGSGADDFKMLRKKVTLVDRSSPVPSMAFFL